MTEVKGKGFGCDISKYADMLDMPVHKSAKHPPMDRLTRAAQFSPFAALTGYEDAIKRTQQRQIDREEERKYEREYFEVGFG